MKKVFLLSIILFIVSCSNKVLKENYTISYHDLPPNVQADFSKIGTTINKFMVVENTNKNCKTTIESGSPTQAIAPKAYLYINTCTKKYKVNFSISSARYFVVDNQKIFFTKSNGFTQKIDTTLSASINLMTIDYGVIDLKNNSNQ